mgnify:CR=1 FL=1
MLGRHAESYVQMVLVFIFPADNNITFACDPITPPTRTHTHTYAHARIHTYTYM